MPAHNRKLKIITLDIGGENFEVQITSWKIKNNTDDGKKTETFAPDGAFVDAAEDSYALELKGISDWTAGGFSNFLWDHDGDELPYQLDHLYDIPGEHVRFNGDLKIKAPDVGGDRGATEITEITLQCVQKPVKTRP